jgi:hypothetical protein
MPAHDDKTAAARLSLALATMLALVACGAPPADETGQAETAAQDAGETVFDDMLETQDRARAVEDLTLGRKDSLDQALEAAEDAEDDLSAQE